MCGYQLGLFGELDTKRTAYLIEGYQEGAKIDELRGHFWAHFETSMTHLIEAARFGSMPTSMNSCSTINLSTIKATTRSPLSPKFFQY